MDPLSIAASATSLAIFVGQLSLAAYSGIEQVKGAEGSLRNLGLELKSLQATLEAVAACLNKTNVKDALHKAVSNDDASAQLRSIEDVITDCERALYEWNSVLTGAPTGRFNSPGIIRSTAIAWKLKAKAAELDSLRNTTSAYNRTIQIHLQLMTLIVSVDTTFAIQGVDRTLGQIKDEIFRLRLQMDAQHDSTQNDASKVPSKIVIKSSLSTSETIVGAASEYFGSIAGTVRDDNTATGITDARTPVDRGDDDVEHLGNWLRDQDIEEISDEEDPDKSLASEVVVVAMEAFERNDHAKTERFLLKFFSLIKNTGGSWDGDELHSAYKKLADCYIHKKDYRKAAEILEIAGKEDDGSSPTRRAQIQHYLAQVEYMLSNFKIAKSYALTSTGISRKDKDRSLYYDTTSLLADICEVNGDDVEAEVYRRRVPPEFRPARIEGWLAPSKHTKRPKSADEVIGGNASQNLDQKKDVFQKVIEGMRAKEPTSPPLYWSEELNKWIYIRKKAEASTSEKPRSHSGPSDSSWKWWSPKEEAEARKKLVSFSDGEYANEQILCLEETKHDETVIITKGYIFVLGGYLHDKKVKWSSVKGVQEGTNMSIIITYTKGLLSIKASEALMFDSEACRTRLLHRMRKLRDIDNWVKTVK